MNCNSKNRSRFRVKSSYSPKRAPKLERQSANAELLPIFARRRSNNRSRRRRPPQLVRQSNDSEAFLQHMSAQQLLNQLDPTGEIRRRRKKNKIKRSRFRVKSSDSTKRPKRAKILAPKLVRQSANAELLPIFSGRGSNNRSPRRTVPKLVRQTNNSEAFLQHMSAQQLLNQLDPTGEIRRKRKKNRSSKFSMGGLKRWLDEKWIDVCYLPKKVSCGRSKGSLSKKRPHYPYCRPSIRISDKTPKLASELTKKEIEKRCKRKRAGKNMVRITGKESRKPTRFSAGGKRDMSYCVCSGPNKTKGFTCRQHCTYGRGKHGRSKFRAGSKVPDNVVDKALYRKIKGKVKKKFLSKPNGKWPSAYGSMALVRAYKKAGGRYKGKKSSFRMSSCKCKENSRAIKKLQKAFDRSRKHKISKMRSRKRRMNTRIKNGSPKTYKGFKTKLKRRLKSSVKRINKNIKFHEIL